MAIQAAAEAAAAAETTSVVSDAGGVTNSITGDAGTFVLGKTIAGGSDEVGKWLMERQSQSFDAFFVPAGTRIAIHVDHELPIDRDTTGRRLTHASLDKISRRSRLVFSSHTTNPLLARYVVKITKMWRKLGAWFWIATQNLEDFPDASRKMFNMMEWWLFLVMPKEEVEQIARFKDLTDVQRSLRHPDSVSNNQGVTNLPRNLI